MYQHCLPWGRLTEHAQSEHRQNVCMHKRESERERSRRREKPIIFNNKECHIKGRTSTALQKCVAYEIRPGTMRHAGMHDFYQFNYWNLNLRQRQGGWDSTTFFWAEGVCESDHRCRTETRSECGPRLQSLRLVDGDTLSGDWARVIWWRLMNTDLLQDFINFCGQSISHRGE